MTQKLCATAMIIMATLSSCQQIDTTAAEQQQAKQTKQVQFVMKGLQVDYTTRATVTSEGMTDLFVFEGTTLLKHQLSTDEDFGTPTISLTYGSHDLTFIASKSTGQTFTTQWQCTKLSDTYGKAMNVTVSKSSSTSRQVELSRVNSKVQWTVEDQIPATAATATIAVDTHYALNASLAAQLPQQYQRSLDVTSKVGATGTVMSSIVMPATYGEENDCQATITFRDASNNTICSYTNTVKVKANRITNIHGSFFEQGGKQTVTLLSEWDKQLDVEL